MNRKTRRMKPTAEAITNALVAQDQATADKLANVLQGYDDRLVAPLRVKLRVALGLAVLAALLAVVGLFV